MTTFFTADTHFGHANIIKYCNRPFADVHSMNEQLIERWNSKVSKEDTVYHLGDFSFSGTVSSYLTRLNGNIILIRGNHDRQVSAFKEVLQLTTIKIENTPIVLCHYPLESWNRQNYRSLMLHGHSHGNMREINNRVDVGVDCWNYEPVTLKEIISARSYT